MPAIRLTAKKDTPQNRLWNGLLPLGQLLDEVMHISIPHELKRQYSGIIIDGRPPIPHWSKVVISHALSWYNLSSPEERLNDMPSPFEYL